MKGQSFFVTALLLEIGQIRSIVIYSMQKCEIQKDPLITLNFNINPVGVQVSSPDSCMSRHDQYFKIILVLPDAQPAQTGLFFIVIELIYFLNLTDIKVLDQV